MKAYETYGILQHPVESYETQWNPMGPCVILCHPQYLISSYVIQWNPVEPYGSILYPM